MEGGSDVLAMLHVGKKSGRMITTMMLRLYA